MRLAFGTFLGLPDPMDFMGDAGYVRGRWQANPSAAFGADADGELVGSNFGTNWGSVGFFGPLTIRPDLWDRGVGKRLMEPVVGCFAAWGTMHAGHVFSPRSCPNPSVRLHASCGGQHSLRFPKPTGPECWSPAVN